MSDFATARTMIAAYVRYITDDRMIAAHVLREFGQHVSLGSIRDIRSEVNKPPRGRRGGSEGGATYDANPQAIIQSVRAADARFVARLLSVHGGAAA